MNKQAEVYLFGQILATRSILLRDGFLKPDEYSEISEQYFLPGGETGTAATVLSSLGVSVIMDGTHIGREVAPVLKDFYKDKSVDLSSLTYTDDAGVTDTVIIADDIRSPMGSFQTLFSSGKRWWGIPKEEDIKGCKAAGIDPYFGEESLLAAEICTRHGIPFVTIDCPHESPLHKAAAIDVISHECIDMRYPGKSPEEVMALMQQSTQGLTIITQGGGEMLYGRRGGEIKRMAAFPVKVRSTLGAGDTFKAGCVYALLHGMSDEETVCFAAACSAVAISRFPLPLDPPKIGEVEGVMGMEWNEAERRALKEDSNE